MVLIVAFLILSGSCFFKADYIIDSDNFGDSERWGISRVQTPERDKQAEKIKGLFPPSTAVTCNNAYKTKETPFTAIVLYRDSGRLLCMGSIIDERHILTAKICYERTEHSDLLVLLGYYKPYWGSWSQVKKASKIIRHEYFLAIIRLTHPISFTDYVQPVRLPLSGTTWTDFDKITKGPLQVVGFMVDRFDVPGDYMDKASVYKMLEDTPIAQGICQQNYTRTPWDPFRQFCVFGNASYCWGGWGGPILMLMKTDKEVYWLQIGVVVLDNCTIDETAPLLAARTDHYADWIRGNSFHGHQPL